MKKTATSLARLSVGSAISVLAFASFASSASAQVAPAPAATAEEDTPNVDIVVTGTLIRNPNLTSSSPIKILNDSEITKRAPNTVEELLRGLPGVSPGVGSQVNNGSNGTNTVDLRGLGVQRNLVLLDGSRIVPSLANGATDLNVIPLALIERVDLLTGGASTTYGADAVSGVVNFITKRNFTGVDVRFANKILETGDGYSFRGDITVGANFADDRGNAVLSFGYTKVDPVYQIQPFSLFGISSTTGRASGASFTSVPTTISFPTQDLQVSGGTLVPQYQGFNFNPYNIFQTPLIRKSIYAATHYDVADGVEFYARGMFSQNTIQSIIAPSGIFGNALTIPANNPYLNSTIRDQLCTANGIALGATCNTNTAIPLPGVYRRLVELGPRVSTYQNNLYDARIGTKIDISKSTSLDISASYGRSEQTSTQSGYVITQRVQQALNATNTTTCIDTTGNCVPVNLFGAAGSITPAQVAYLQAQSTIRINTELYQARAVLSGDFGSLLPTSDKAISYAVGAEYRKYKYDRIPDAFAQDPSALGGAGGATLPFTGGYDVKEAFAELIAPLVTDKPFFNDLTLEAGIRYSSYSVQAAGSPKFNTTTYKGGATWEPVKGVRFRGNYQRAVRAPNIGELFAPTVTGLTNVTTEPCVGAAPLTNANLRAICLAQGAPVASIGSIQDPSAGQANATGGGNPAIRPEKADTFTVGAVFTPSQIVPGLSIGVDYFNIKVNQAITSALPSDVLGACFNNITAASATSAACTSIRRNPANGRLSGPTATTFGLPTPLTNNGRYATDGIDLTADYGHKFGEFGLDLSFRGTWTDNLKFAASPTSVTRDCVGYFSVNCGPSLGQIMPELSWQQRTTLSARGVSLSVLWRHLDSVQYEGQAADFVARGYTAANRNLFRGVVTNAAGANSALAGQTVDFNRIPAYNYIDLTVQFEVAKEFVLTLGVQNAFNKQPPVVGGQAGSTAAGSGNIFPSTYDPLGRSFNAAVRVKF
ncbi:TonB-dependent receptor domain-containing protein [Sphingomonas sp. HMP6]|uniref:TonB-dependent receptor domain-containing protein n=1 Tax=Sphingomonas sp. HMP6 TaxID=1517551 RepID=UPI001596A512|nr:TonB-dependent receptor [Sphingomonas sp. HMP6]BCA58669.1 TonB-dependent receptor [Sphingomonas sp. HMP6]